MREDAACLDLLLWEVKGSCHTTQNASSLSFLWHAEGLKGGRKKGEKEAGEGVARLISASVPCACQSNILKQHMHGFATANYPALGTGTEKHLRRTIKRAWLVVRAVSKCWQIVIFNEYTALELPIKRSLSEHCSFVKGINFLCNRQISSNETDTEHYKGKSTCLPLFFVRCLAFATSTPHHPSFIS